MRVIFYTFISLLGISLSIIILMPSLFDINNYKEKIESLVYSKTGNTLKIKGNINVTLLTGLKLSVKDISFISNDGEDLFKSKELLIAPQLFPLLKGDLKFNAIKIIQPTVYVTKKNSKKYNWVRAFNKNIEDKSMKDLNRSLKNNNKNNQKKLNPLNINSLSIVDAEVLSSDEKKKNKYSNIDVRLNYKNNNKYFMEGNFSYKKEKINFSYDLNYLEKNVNIKGSVIGKSFKVINNTNIDTNTLSGQSTINIEVNELDSLLKNNYLSDQSLRMDANLSFTEKSIKFNDASVKNKKNLINLKGDLTKKGNVNIVNVNLNSNILDMNDFFYFNSKIKRSSELQGEKQTEKNTNENKQKHLVDNIFEKLNFFDIYADFSANEVLYKNHNIKNVKVKFSKKKNLNIAVSLNNNFAKELKIKSKINKKKFSTFVIYAKNLDVEKVNDYMGYNRLSGLLNLSIEGNTNVKNKKSIMNQLNGELKLNTKSLQINGINLKKMKSNILRIENIDDILEFKKNVFKGNTNISNQDLFIKIANGQLKLPETDILLDENKIIATGFYELIPQNINVNLNFNDEKNKLLSLFNVNFKGNINKMVTTLDYDKEKTNQLIGDMVEKKMKKVIKDKLDNKFNDIIENLLN